jgi:hypothetical protein
MQVAVTTELLKVADARVMSEFIRRARSDQTFLLDSGISLTDLELPVARVLGDSSNNPMSFTCFRIMFRSGMFLVPSNPFVTFVLHYEHVNGRQVRARFATFAELKTLVTGMKTSNCPGNKKDE